MCDCVWCIYSFTMTIHEWNGEHPCVEMQTFYMNEKACVVCVFACECVFK